MIIENKLLCGIWLHEMGVGLVGALVPIKSTILVCCLWCSALVSSEASH